MHLIQTTFSPHCDLAEAKECNPRSQSCKGEERGSPRMAVGALLLEGRRPIGGWKQDLSSHQRSRACMSYWWRRGGCSEASVCVHVHEGFWGGGLEPQLCFDSDASKNLSKLPIPGLLGHQSYRRSSRPGRGPAGQYCMRFEKTQPFSKKINAPNSQPLSHFSAF